MLGISVVYYSFTARVLTLKRTLITYFIIDVISHSDVSLYISFTAEALDSGLFILAPVPDYKGVRFEHVERFIPLLPKQLQNIYNIYLFISLKDNNL